MYMQCTIDEKYVNRIHNETNDIGYLKKCIAEKDLEIKDLKNKLRDKLKN